MGIAGRSLRAAAALLLVAAPSLSAQFNGTWTVQGEKATVTVTMQQDAQGNVRGTWTGAGTMQIEGMVEEGIAMGAIYNQEGGVYFEAEVQGAQLRLALIEAGADNQPDYSKMTDLVLTSTAGGGAVPPAAGRAANPLAGGTGGADPVVGTYEGEGVRLQLQPGQGGYTGSITVQGQSYPLTAMGSGGQVRGTFNAGGQQYEFQAQLQGSQLTLASGGTTYRLSKAGGAANPLAGGARSQPAATGASGLTGRWSCQSNEGPAQLEFVSQNQLTYNGERLAYQMGDGVLQVQTEWGMMSYQYRLSGDRLHVSGTDGTSLDCSRGGAAAAAPGGMGGAGGAGQYNALLRGQYCSYSSSPDGGYSTTRRMYFDGVGRVTHATLGEFDVPEGVGYGQGAGDPGSYSVTGFQKGSDVYIKFDSSDQTHAFKVYVGDAQGIYELWFREQVYSPQLCP
jgi:hypothetical protein